MKIQSSFPTKFRAGQYLKDRGWVLTNSILRKGSFYTHPTIKTHNNVIHKVQGKWYITAY